MNRTMLYLAAISAIVVSAPAEAQGQGGYADGTPGASTAQVTPSAKAKMRKHHMTNDTSGGNSSVDKSGMTHEGGGAMAGAQGSEQGMGAHAAGNTGGTKTEPTGH